MLLWDGLSASTAARIGLLVFFAWCLLVCLFARLLVGLFVCLFVCSPVSLHVYVFISFGVFWLFN